MELLLRSLAIGVRTILGLLLSSNGPSCTWVLLLMLKEDGDLIWLCESIGVVGLNGLSAFLWSGVREGLFLVSCMIDLVRLVCWRASWWFSANLLANSSSPVDWPSLYTSASSVSSSSPTSSLSSMSSISSTSLSSFYYIIICIYILILLIWAVRTQLLDYVLDLLDEPVIGVFHQHLEDINHPHRSSLISQRTQWKQWVQSPIHECADLHVFMLQEIIQYS